MREYGLDEWRAMREATIPEIAKLASGPRRIRRKPRSPEQRALIEKMAVAAVRRRADEGRLVRLGPRSYELRPRIRPTPVTAQHPDPGSVS